MRHGASRGETATWTGALPSGWLAGHIQDLDRADLRGVNSAGSVSADRRSDRSVALVVKAAVAAAGHDPKAYSGHSLRSGFCTSAARAGVPEAHIQAQSRHKSLPVLRGYIRRGSLFLDNAAGRVGL